MTAQYIAISIIEFLTVAGVIVAAFNEKKLAKLEKRLFQKIKNIWR